MSGHTGPRSHPRAGKGKSSRPRDAVRKGKGKKDGEEGLFIWGIHPVLDLLVNEPARLKKVLFLKEPAAGRLQEIAEYAAKAHCPVSVGLSFADLIPADAVHQGVAALAEAARFLSLEQLLAKRQATAASTFFVALDCLQDPHNLGAIIRSAAAAGVNGIILPKDRSAPVSATVYKVSVGTVATVDLCQVTNMSSTLNLLREHGVWVFGLDGVAERSIFELDLAVPLCLVVGGEGKGIRPLVKRCCDTLAAIPLAEKVESLNASAAAAVALFEVVRQRSGVHTGKV